MGYPASISHRITGPWAGVPHPPPPSKLCKVFEGETLGLDLRLADEIKGEKRPACTGQICQTKNSAGVDRPVSSFDRLLEKSGR